MLNSVAIVPRTMTSDILLTSVMWDKCARVYTKVEGRGSRVHVEGKVEGPKMSLKVPEKLLLLLRVYHYKDHGIFCFYIKIMEYFVYFEYYLILYFYKDYEIF